MLDIVTESPTRHASKLITHNITNHASYSNDRQMNKTTRNFTLDGLQLRCERIQLRLFSFFPPFIAFPTNLAKGSRENYIFPVLTQFRRNRKPISRMFYFEFKYWKHESKNLGHKTPDIRHWTITWHLIDWIQSWQSSHGILMMKSRHIRLNFHLIFMVHFHVTTSHFQIVWSTTIRIMNE